MLFTPTADEIDITTYTIINTFILNTFAHTIILITLIYIVLFYICIINILDLQQWWRNEFEFQLDNRKQYQMQLITILIKD
jgi:hypothetical protein